jgi:hypothetical protein
MDTENLTKIAEQVFSIAYETAKRKGKEHQRRPIFPQMDPETFALWFATERMSQAMQERGLSPLPGTIDRLTGRMT